MRCGVEQSVGRNDSEPAFAAEPGLDSDLTGIKIGQFRSTSGREDVVCRGLVPIAAMMMPDAEDVGRWNPPLDFPRVKIHCSEIRLAR